MATLAERALVAQLEWTTLDGTIGTGTERIVRIDLGRNAYEANNAQRTELFGGVHDRDGVWMVLDTEHVGTLTGVLRRALGYRDLGRDDQATAQVVLADGEVVRVAA